LQLLPNIGHFLYGAERVRRFAYVNMRCIVTNLKAETDKQNVVFALLKTFLRTPTGRRKCTSKNLGDFFSK